MWVQKTTNQYVTYFPSRACSVHQPFFGRGHGSCYVVLPHCDVESSSLTHIGGIHPRLQGRELDGRYQAVRDIVKKKKNGPPVLGKRENLEIYMKEYKDKNEIQLN